MKAVLQRVSRASVAVEGQQIAAIGHGLLILICAEQNDADVDSTFLARKCAELRIFADEQGKMNKSIKEVEGSALVVSQFTLAADWRKGRRPSFIKAAPPAEGERLYLKFADELRAAGVPVQTGIFGADMDVELVNDGPVTLILDHQTAAEALPTAAARADSD
jgi:D-tyrosyl-tRNA(Tyr) deacylase